MTNLLLNSTLHFGPGSLHNPNASPPTVTLLDRPLEAVMHRLDALLLVLKSCKQDSCRDPWSTLTAHMNSTENGPKSLRAALDGKYDEFFAKQPRVSFGWCDRGYKVMAEGPMSPIRLGADGVEESEDGSAGWFGDFEWEGLEYERM